MHSFTVRIGILFHSSSEAFLNYARLVGEFWRFLTLLSRSSHECSMEDKSGLYGGQSSVIVCQKIPTNSGYMWLGFVLLKISWHCCTTRTATRRKISSLYLTAVKLPSIKINSNFTPCAVPPQTITEPPQTYPVRQRKRRLSVFRDVSTCIHDVDHPGEQEWSETRP